MTTVVNNPASTGESNGGISMIFGLIALFIVAYLFFIYGFPAIKQMGTPQINIPNKIDVNVQPAK